MPRLAPLDLAKLTPEQKKVADAIVSGPRGGLRGLDAPEIPGSVSPDAERAAAEERSGVRIVPDLRFDRVVPNPQALLPLQPSSTNHSVWRYPVKFRCERDTLAESIGITQRAVAARSGAMPVLSGIKVTAADVELRMARRHATI